MSRTSEQIREALAAVNTNARVAFSRGRTIRDEVEKTENALLVSLVRHEGHGDPDAMSLGEFIGSPVVKRLGDLKLLLGLIEASPEHDLAVREIIPLHAELAAALEKEDAEAAALSAASHAVVEAEESAKLKLLAKIEADPAVVKAKANLAGIKRLGVPLESADHARFLSEGNQLI